MRVLRFRQFDFSDSVLVRNLPQFAVETDTRPQFSAQRCAPPSFGARCVRSLTKRLPLAGSDSFIGQLSNDPSCGVRTCFPCGSQATGRTELLSSVKLRHKLNFKESDLNFRRCLLNSVFSEVSRDGSRHGLDTLLDKRLDTRIKTRLETLLDTLV